MLTKIFKPGVMVEVWGYHCDWKDVEENEIDGWLSSGWYRSPYDFDKDDIEPEPKRRGRPPKVKTDDND
jgi:hypothetical protein